MQPLEVFRESVSAPLKVYLTNQSVYSGVLTGFDLHVNIALKDAEYTPGDAPNAPAVKIGRCLINGSTIAYIELI